MSGRLSRYFGVSGLIFAAILLAACRQDMHDQPKYKSLRASNLFKDSRSARPLVEGTVSRGQLRDDELLYTGRNGEELTQVFPFPVTRALLARGRERYDIFCTPCHSHLGDGNGMVIQRGFRRPPSFHIDRLRDAPAGHYFDVITNGFGAMASYSSRISAADRWAIIAYVRALQLSQNATPDDAPAGEREKLLGAKQ